MSSIIIAKHGERLDDVQPENLWANYCSEHCDDSFDYFCRVNDAPLTRRGNQQSKGLGLTLDKCVDVGIIKYIFASKLLRCAETACEIAQVLRRPVVLSEAFSQSIEAVQQHKKFDFITVDELETCYPGVKLIDGDRGDTSGTSPARLDIMLPPSGQWSDAIAYIATHFPLSIVVGHGKNIRSMAGRPLYTPYCSFAVFNFSPLTDHPVLENLFDADGIPIDMTEIPSDSLLNSKKRKSPEEGEYEGYCGEEMTSLPLLAAGGPASLIRRRLSKARRSKNRAVLAFSHERDEEVEEEFLPRIAEQHTPNIAATAVHSLRSKYSAQL